MIFYITKLNKMSFDKLSIFFKKNPNTYILLNISPKIFNTFLIKKLLKLKNKYKLKTEITFNDPLDAINFFKKNSNNSFIKNIDLFSFIFYNTYSIKYYKKLFNYLPKNSLYFDFYQNINYSDIITLNKFFKKNKNIKWIYQKNIRLSSYKKIHIKKRKIAICNRIVYKIHNNITYYCRSKFCFKKYCDLGEQYFYKDILEDFFNVKFNL